MHGMHFVVPKRTICNSLGLLRKSLSTDSSLLVVELITRYCKPHWLLGGVEGLFSNLDLMQVRTHNGVPCKGAL